MAKKNYTNRISAVVKTEDDKKSTTMKKRPGASHIVRTPEAKYVTKVKNLVENHGESIESAKAQAQKSTPKYKKPDYNKSIAILKTLKKAGIYRK